MGGEASITGSRRLAARNVWSLPPNGSDWSKRLAGCWQRKDDVMREWWSKLCLTLTGRRAIAKDLTEEIESNLALETEDNIAKSMQPDESRRAASRHFGNSTLPTLRSQAAWTFPSLATSFQDIP